MLLQAPNEAVNHIGSSNGIKKHRLPSDSVALRGISFVGAPGVSLICMPQPLQCGTALIPLHSLFSMLIVVLSCLVFGA